MASRQPVERERSETRQSILDAARELFAESGFEAVSMRKIAARVGLTPTAIYFHFHDKRALFIELCRGDFLSLAHEFAAIARIPDPVERLRRTGYAYIDFAMAHPNHYRLMFMSPAPTIGAEEMPDYRGNPEQDAYAFAQLTVGDAIAAGRLGPQYADVEQVTQIVWAAAHGVVSLHIAKASDPFVQWGDVRATARALVDITIHGLTCDAAVHR
jgi:AcrR family transcriptional regulator